MRVPTSQALALLLLASPTLPGQAIRQVFSTADANASLGAEAYTNPFLDTVTTDGSLVYALLRQGNADTGAVVAFDTTTNTFSTILAPSAYAAVTSQAPIVIYGLTLTNTGTSLRYLNALDNSVYDLDLPSGNLSVAGTGPSSFSSNAAFRSDGSGLAYNPSDDSLYAIGTGAGFSVLVDELTLNLVYGTDIVTGSLEVAGDSLFFGSNSTDNLNRLSLSGGPLNAASGVLLSQAQIGAVTGGATVGFADIFAAPDGLIYFYDTVSDNILSFDEADPEGSLTIALSDVQLDDGPGDDTIEVLAWLDGNLAWLDRSGGGFFAIPEPSSASAWLTILVAVALLRLHRA